MCCTLIMYTQVLSPHLISADDPQRDDTRSNRVGPEKHIT